MKHLWMLDRFLWFNTFTLSYHCFLVVFPTLWINNYIYGVAIACYMLMPLFYKPLRELKV